MVDKIVPPDPSTPNGQIPNGAYRFRGRVQGNHNGFPVDEDVVVQGGNFHLFGEYEIRPLNEFKGTLTRLVEPPSLDALVIAADNLRQVERPLFLVRFALEKIDSYIQYLKGDTQ